MGPVLKYRVGPSRLRPGLKTPDSDSTELAPIWCAAPKCGGQTQKKVGTRRVGGPNFRAFVSLSRHSFILFFSLSGDLVSFFSLSGGLLVEFWWCFGWPDPQMCTFSLWGCRVKAPGGLQAAGTQQHTPTHTNTHTHPHTHQHTNTIGPNSVWAPKLLGVDHVLGSPCLSLPQVAPSTSPHCRIPVTVQQEVR